MVMVVVVTLPVSFTVSFTVMMMTVVMSFAVVMMVPPAVVFVGRDAAIAGGGRLHRVPQGVRLHPCALLLLPFPGREGAQDARDDHKDAHDGGRENRGAARPSILCRCRC